MPGSAENPAIMPTSPCQLRTRPSVAVSTGAVGEWQGMRAAFAVVAGVSFVLLAVGMNRLRMAVATPATPATPAGA